MVIGLLACSTWDQEVTLRGDVHLFHGIPSDRGWGEEIVVHPRDGYDAERVMGPMGGVPVIDAWTERGGVAVMNLSTVQEPMEVRVRRRGDETRIRVRGGSDLVRFEHDGDWATALREFALRMEERGIATQRAPDWAFEPVWETYGFEERWSPEDVYALLPLLRELGVGTITLDSGWYGRGTKDWDARTGDFPINPDVVGTEEDFVAFLARLHDEGFRVRLWWSPGVVERGTDIAKAHRAWLREDVQASWGESGDVYVDATDPEVVAWNRSIVERFVGYGADGFKQDDVYQYVGGTRTEQRAYNALFADLWDTARAAHPEFSINTCNCGVVQNFYDFPGESELITSDPVGSRQFRQRAKTYHALNVGGAAILGDHVELTLGDVGRRKLAEDGFYDRVTDEGFASIVPLGMVLETKLTRDPGDRYRRWFALHREHAFPAMEWVDVPWYGDVETYLLRDGDTLWFSFFDDEPRREVELVLLEDGRAYEVRELLTGERVGTFVAEGEAHALDLDWEDFVVLEVAPAD